MYMDRPTYGFYALHMVHDTAFLCAREKQRWSKLRTGSHSVRRPGTCSGLPQLERAVISPGR